MSQPGTPPNETLSESHVRRVARLARLELTDEQVRESQTRLSAVLGFMQTLAQVDVSGEWGGGGGGVEEMTSPLRLRNVLREDEPSPPLEPGSPAQLRYLAIAPQPIGPYIGVPKTLEQES